MQAGVQIEAHPLRFIWLPLRGRCSFHRVELRVKSVIDLAGLSWILLVPSVGATPSYIRLIPNQPPVVDVAVIAHQDDWQLFMGDVLDTEAPLRQSRRLCVPDRRR
jgi:hypothetical protein